ncbi:MAG: class I SAM-dependent methyltransferase, partial [Candidatus Methanoperedens sp.]|nr:class I SAM-dependent methyltransferase [Candidatus Methanoperedens sp.]
FVANRPNCRLDLLRMDSQQASTREQILKLLNQRPIDFLFIDGDHRYNGVKKDYALYSGLVRPGGLIAFHDIRPNRYDSTIEVARLWEEIKISQPQTREIIHEPYTGRYGIGIVTVSADI